MVTLVHLSDIHYCNTGKTENQEVVLEAFQEDLASQLKGVSPENLYLIISGDIVYSGEKKNYTDFNDYFLIKIQEKCSIKKDNILLVAGNHDISLSYINKHRREISNFDNYNENDFNDYIQEAKSADENESFHIIKKFTHYNSFCKSIVGDDRFDISGYGTDMGENLSVYCLNSSLCCNGDSLMDNGKLCIDTRSLHNWLMEKKGKQKILVMHHPLEYLTGWARMELNKILDNENFILLLTGHLHYQDIGEYITHSNRFIHSHAPHLYKDKKDELGYSIVTLKKDKSRKMNVVEKVLYRQWAPKRGFFFPGVFFANNQDGIYRPSLPYELIANNQSQKKGKELSIPEEKKSNLFQKLLCNMITKH